MKRGFRLPICLLLLLAIAAASTLTACAATEDVLEKLSEYDINSISNIVNSTLRQGGFWIVKGLAAVTDDMYTAIQEIYDLISFSYSDEIIAITSKYKVLYKILFVVTLTFFGMKLMLSKQTNRMNVVNCILCIALVLAAMPLCMQKMGDLTSSASDYAIHQWGNVSSAQTTLDGIASSVIQSNFVDLRRVDKAMKDGELPADLQNNKPYVSKKVKLKHIDINEYMDTSDSAMALQNEDVWENKLDYDHKGEPALVKIKGWTKMTSSYYYRWQCLSWLAMIVELACITLVLFLLAIRAARIIIDLAMAMIYTPFIAVTDLSTGQRIKEALKDIVAHFAALFLIVALLSVYFVAVAYVNEQEIMVVAKIAMHIAILWAIIDGPNIIERIAGIDVGYNGAWKALLGAKAVADVAKGIGKAGLSAGKLGAKAAAKTAGGAGSMLAGKEAMNNLKQAPGAAMDAVKGKVHEATDGKGLLGLGKNAAESLQTKMKGEHSPDSLEHEASKHEERSSGGKPDLQGSPGMRTSGSSAGMDGKAGGMSPLESDMPASSAPDDASVQSAQSAGTSSGSVPAAENLSGTVHPASAGNSAETVSSAGQGTDGGTENLSSGSISSSSPASLSESGRAQEAAAMKPSASSRPISSVDNPNGITRPAGASSASSSAAAGSAAVNSVPSSPGSGRRQQNISSQENHQGGQQHMQPAMPRPVAGSAPASSPANAQPASNPAGSGRQTADLSRGNPEQKDKKFSGKSRGKDLERKGPER